MNPHFEKLHNYFKSFPGIGRRQAERFVYHILAQDSQWLDGFVREMQNVKKTVHECSNCFYIFKQNGENVCQYCNNTQRDNTTLAIVEKSSDVEILIQKTRFPGRFFVLGGQIPVIEKKKRKPIRLEEVVERIKNLHKNGLQEIIICTSYNPDGIFTATVVKDKIKEVFGNTFRITTFGRGFSTGTELEYADSETLRYALEHRTDL